MNDELEFDSCHVARRCIGCGGILLLITCAIFSLPGSIRGWAAATAFGSMSCFNTGFLLAQRGRAMRITPQSLRVLHYKGFGLLRPRRVTEEFRVFKNDLTRVNFHRSPNGLLLYLVNDKLQKVWVLREASNVPCFSRKNRDRLEAFFDSLWHEQSKAGQANPWPPGKMGDCAAPEGWVVMVVEADANLRV